jgi:predicted  nucleic acid-binding Zn-ribbon protein
VGPPLGRSLAPVPAIPLAPFCKAPLLPRRTPSQTKEKLTEDVPLRDQLRRLEELQQHDARIQELENSLKAIPAKLASTQTDLARVEGMLATERAALTETERYYAEQKSLLTDDEQSVAGAKHKLTQAKNSKEYMAAQREIETRRESLTGREGEIAKLVEAVDAKKKLLTDKSTDVQALKDSILKDSDAARSRMSELEGKIAALRAERDALAAGVKPEVLKRYGTIRMRRGLAVVSVRNGTCQGCNMNIPPQLYNTLQRGQTIETCPSCHRIIYWEDLMKDPPAAETSGSGS